MASKAEVKNGLFLEDTLAHEEEFGTIDTRIHKLEALDSSLPIIGVQKTTPKTIKINEVDTEVVSVRFVAAVTIDLEHLEDVHPVWSRILYNVAGDGTLKSSDTLESGNVYGQLNDGGSPTMPSSFGAGYNRFVTYTMKNIPTAYNSCYFNVSLSLNGVSSKVLATTVDLSSHFAFNSNSSNFFLTGTMVNDIAQDVDTREEYDGQNAASFTADLAAGDSFKIVQKTNSYFKFWDSSNLEDEGNGFSKAGDISVSTAARYCIYLNTSNEIYHAQFRLANTSHYLRGTAGGGWGNDTGDIGLASQYHFVTDPDNKAVLLGVTLSVGDFKISDQNWSHYWGFKACKDGGDEWQPNGGSSIVIGGAKDNFEEAAKDGNIHCKVAGTYDIYLTNNWYVSIELSA